MTMTSYKVTGMNCEHCTNAVTSELRGIDGVSAVTVGLVPDGLSLVTVTSATAIRRRGRCGTRRGRRLPHRRLTLVWAAPS
jgi:copper chaperone CopZ